jgi:hypothetical protein
MSYTAYCCTHLTVVAELGTKSLLRYSLQLLVATRYDQVLENTSNDLVLYI